MILIRIIVVYIVCCYHGSFEDSNIIELYQTYCPYTKLCNHAPLLDNTSIPNDFVPCCLPCHCDAQCRMFSDCCPDAPVISKSDQVVAAATCREPRHQKEKVKQINTIYSGRKFMMVDSCPPDYDGPLREACDGIFDRNKTLDDVVVVSDSAYPSRTFANKYCAMCNGIEEITRWKLRGERCLILPDHWNSLPLSEVEDFLMEHCDIISIPTPGLALLSAFCELGKQTCDDGAKEPDIADACAAPSFLPRHPDFLKTSTLIRRNVFCYACTRLETSATTKKVLCERSQMETSGVRNEGYILFIDIRTDVFSQDENPTEDVHDGKHKHACARGELFDHVTERCRDLHCVWFAGIEDNTCKPFGDVGPGCLLAMTMIFVLREPSQVPNSIAQEDIRFIEDELNKRIRLHDCPFRIRHFAMYREHTTGFVKFLRADMQLSISEDCTFNHIIYNTQEYAEKAWSQNITVEKVVLQTISKIDFYRALEVGIIHNTSIYLAETVYTYNKLLRRQRLKVSMFTCPYFVLNSTEYRNISLIHFRNHSEHWPDGNFNMATILQDGFYAIAEDKVAVCTDTLFALGNTASLAGYVMRRIFAMHFVMLSILRFLKAIV